MSKKFILLIIIIIVISLLSAISAIWYFQNKDGCIALVVPLRNQNTGECRIYSTPCDVPDNLSTDWIGDQSCVNEREKTGLSPQKPNEDSPFQGPTMGDDIIIDEQDKSCTSDTDCVVISTACGDCGLDVTNKNYIQKYKTKLDQFCKNKYPEYPKRGYLACDVDYRPTHEIKCVDLRCKLVPKQ